jgi:hypothetical protein
LVAVVNVIVFWISFLDNSLLLHRSAIGFYMMILYPATLLNLLISLIVFYV